MTWDSPLHVRMNFQVIKSISRFDGSSPQSLTGFHILLFQALRKQCQDFATALLDHTRSSYELEILLNYDPDGPAYQVNILRPSDLEETFLNSKL